MEIRRTIEKSRKNQTLKIVFGGILIGIAVINMFSCIGDGPMQAGLGDRFFLVIIILGIGIALLATGCYGKGLLAKYGKYAPRITSDPTHSIRRLAESVNENRDEVLSSVRSMVKRKYFGDAYIDETTLCMVFPGETPGMNQENQGEVSQKTYSDPSVEKFTIRCKGCGAMNIVPKNRVVECEYCGVMLKGEKKEK